MLYQSYADGRDSLVSGIMNLAQESQIWLICGH